MDHAIIDNYRDLPIGVYLDILTIQETELDEFRRQALTVGALAALNEQEVLALPIYPEITEDEVSYVCEKIREFYKS